MRDSAFAPYHCLEFCSKLGSFGRDTIGYRDADTWTCKPSLLCVNFVYFYSKIAFIFCLKVSSLLGCDSVLLDEFLKSRNIVVLS